MVSTKTSKVSFGNFNIQIKTEKNNEDEQTPMFKHKYRFIHHQTKHNNIFLNNTDSNKEEHKKVCDDQREIPFVHDGQYSEEDIMCWWCKTVKVDKDKKRFLPTDYDEKRQRYKYIGYFCSWNCVKAFNFDHPQSSIRTKRAMYINRICSKLYGKHVQVTPTMHWYLLKQFGGHLTIEDLHKHTLF